MIYEQIVIFSLLSLALAVNLVAETRDDDLMRAYSKPLLIPLILAYYLLMAENTDLLICAALIFALAGDISLLSKSNFAFRLGAGFFLLGHVAYVTGMLLQLPLQDMDPVDYLWPVIPAFIPSIVCFRYLNPYFGRFRPMGITYMLFGTSLLYVCLLRFDSIPLQSFLLAITGALLFQVSDFFIAFTRFRQDFRYSGVLIMLTYVAGELLLIMGLI